MPAGSVQQPELCHPRTPRTSAREPLDVSAWVAAALAAFYSKDIFAPQQAYVYALESYERLKRNPSPPADSLALATQQLSTARDNLELIGMGQGQMEELSRTRREMSDINLAAPADGQILERHVAVGQRFMKGELLYRIANLKRVWVLADMQRG